MLTVPRLSSSDSKARNLLACAFFDLRSILLQNLKQPLKLRPRQPQVPKHPISIKERINRPLPPTHSFLDIKFGLRETRCRREDNLESGRLVAESRRVPADPDRQICFRSLDFGLCQADELCYGFGRSALRPGEPFAKVDYDLGGDVRRHVCP